MAVNKVSVQSSNLASVGYDDEHGVLEVEFHNGRVYEYYLVPEDVYRGLVNALSAGEYFASYVRDQYRFRRIQ